MKVFRILTQAIFYPDASMKTMFNDLKTLFAVERFSMNQSI